MLNDFFLICYHLAPFLVPFFTLAGILTWISDRFVERTAEEDGAARQTEKPTQQEQNTPRRPAC